MSVVAVTCAAVRGNMSAGGGPTTIFDCPRKRSAILFYNDAEAKQFLGVSEQPFKRASRRDMPLLVVVIWTWH
jgi:hypothetical protein